MNCQLHSAMLLFIAIVASTPCDTNAWLWASDPPITEKCFQDPGLNLGCFNSSGPFKEFPLPYDLEDLTVRFTIYPRKGFSSFTIPGIKRLDPNTVLPIDPQRKLAFLVHGFRGSSTKPFILALKDSLLDLGDPKLTVIVVEWPKGAMSNKWKMNPKREKRSKWTYKLVKYDQGASNARVVGAMIARFVHYVQTSPKYNAEYIHCIGFSLGAQACGFAGKRYQILTNSTQQFDRITGLDPAGPLFEASTLPGAHLWYTDARYVDVIHTNSLTLGYTDPLGHVDFYPGVPGHWGDVQPGCMVSGMNSLLDKYKIWVNSNYRKIDGRMNADQKVAGGGLRVEERRKRAAGSSNSSSPWNSVKDFFQTKKESFSSYIYEKRRAVIGCSHHRAWQYYANSIRGLCQYNGTTDWKEGGSGQTVRMGYFEDQNQAPEGQRLRVYVRVKGESPFC